MTAPFESRSVPAGVIRTKLFPPSPRFEEMRRSELLARLRSGFACKLALIEAPVGYGKTTLLNQWRRTEEPELPFAWVSLDKQDNDPVRLWKHIVEALRGVAPDKRFGADAIAGMGIIGTRLVDAALPALVNELAALPQRVVLVIDDYHYLTDGECHESVDFLVRHLPVTVHLVISTRSDPPLDLGRLRARGEVNELRGGQLAFSEEEAVALLRGRLGLDIERGDIVDLLERTEGWPAGIYLAYLSMKGRDAHAFVSALRGSSRYVVDLLAEEVLTVLSEEERDFMIRTSVLERMSGPLCDEVLQADGSGALLNKLAHSNLLVVPLDDGGRWYRYHRLFADFLLYELKNTSPELVPVLHERASVWFERERRPERAIEHATAAGDHERAGQLIARHWFGYVASGQTATVRGWLEVLPEDFVCHTAPLAIVEAWIYALQGERKETERSLKLAESSPYQGVLPDGTPSVEAGVTLVRGFFGYGGVGAWVEAAERAIRMESGQASSRTALACIGLGMGRYCSGDTEDARMLLEEGLGLTTNDLPVLRIAMLSFLSFAVLDGGETGEAESLARKACALVDGFNLHRLPQAGLATIALGRVLAKRGDLAGAKMELETGLSARRDLPAMSPWPTLVGLLALADVLITRGDGREAQTVLTEARAILEMYPDAGIFPELLGRQEQRLRKTRSDRSGSTDGRLTERELEVLDLLQTELSVSELGKLLYVSPSTIKSHVKCVYRKLGVSSRKEAVEQSKHLELI